MREPEPSTHRPFLFSGLCLVASFVLAMTACGTVMAQSTEEAVPGGVVFQFPDGHGRNRPPGFNGMFMVARTPSGMFVIYPDNNETTEALRQRVLRLVVRMFFHNDKGRANLDITWNERPMLAHPDDGDGQASAYLYLGFTQQVQVVIYERTTGPRPFLYGYFAMRSKSDGCPDGEFLDEQGQGVKAFDDLWKSFSQVSNSSGNQTGRN